MCAVLYVITFASLFIPSPECAHMSPSTCKPLFIFLHLILCSPSSLVRPSALRPSAHNPSFSRIMPAVELFCDLYLRVHVKTFLGVCNQTIQALLPTEFLFVLCIGASRQIAPATDTVLIHTKMPYLPSNQCKRGCHSSQKSRMTARISTDNPLPPPRL